MSSDLPPKNKAVRSIDGIVREKAPAPQQASVSSKRKFRPRKPMLWGGIGVVITVAITGIVIFVTHGSDLLPTAVTKQVGFPVYYPSPMSPGYMLQQESVRVENGVLFYTLKDGGSSVVISEQATPQNPPNLSELVGFTSLKTIAGNAAVGVGSGSNAPVVIIVSNTTLITMTGQRNMPSDVVSTIAQNMRSSQ
jgi:hypothetical protein